MSERRRFFPATPVQQVPGRTVELEMRLRPEAPVATATATASDCECECECECEVVGVGWFSTLLAPGIDAGARESDAYPGHTEVSTWLPQHQAEMRTIWVRPADDDLGSMPWEGPQCRCVRIEIRTRPGGGVSLFGAVIGTRLCDVTWQLQWDAPGPEPGVSGNDQKAVAAGSGLWVTGRGVQATQPDQTETLTAMATCDGEPVGVLTLVLHHQMPA